MKLTLQFDDVRWKQAAKNLPARIKAAIALIDQDYECDSDTLTVKCADDAAVKALNAQFRGKNKPTNVLSFPNDDAPLGDIILAFETIEKEALTQGKRFENHALHLVVHGTLHLLGYNHEDDVDAQVMEAEEITILARMGIENPYVAG